MEKLNRFVYNLKKAKNILVCPLDWGLGHATRIVPLVENLIQMGQNVLIGADNNPLVFLKQRFPNCRFVKFPGFTPTYPASGNMAFAMISQYPKMMQSAKKSKLLLDEIIEKEKIDILISDNRYELSSEKVYSIFITHQLNIQTKGLQNVFKPLIDRKIYSFLKKFNEIWVPDFPDSTLSGKLSSKPLQFQDKIKFIGSQSRFGGMRFSTSEKKYDVLAIMSGPEPQRSIFEEIILKQLIDSGLKSVILSAKPGDKSQERIDNILKISHLDDDKFASMINSSELIITRPGYSSLMDLVCFGAKAILVPTPGQTEQEYLSEFHMNAGHYFSMPQQKFNLAEAIKMSKKYKGLKLENDINLLKLLKLNIENAIK